MVESCVEDQSSFKFVLCYALYKKFNSRNLLGGVLILA